MSTGSALILGVNMLSSNILPLAEAYVNELYVLTIPKWRTFHDFHHTAAVVKKCRELATFYEVDTAESFALLIAAWFHDTGFSKGDNNHELNSITIANAFLSPFPIDENILRLIRVLILATKLPVNPHSLCAQIICDCDLHHLGSANYDEWSSKLRAELEHQRGQPFADEWWNNENISFFGSHHYFTDFARSHWDEQKKINLSRLQEVS